MTMITSYWTLDGTIVLMISMTAAYLFMTRKFNYWKERGVFHIKPLPFFGNFASCMFLTQAPGFLFRDLYNRAKEQPYIGFHIFDKPALLIRDREIVKDILVTDFDYFCNRYSMSDSKDRLGCSTLFLIKNPNWEFVRKKLTPIFTPGKLKKMFDLLLECVVNLDTYLDSLTANSNGRIIDMKDLFANLTTDMIGTTAFGLNIDSLNNPECEFRKNGRKIFDLNIIRSIQLFVAFYYPELCSYAHVTMFGDESTDFLRKVFWDTINYRIQSGESRGDVIDTLIKLKRVYADQDLGDFQFDGDDLMAQAATFFLGGFETSSSTMSFTLYELATHPEVQDKLRKEIFDALHETDGEITYDMVTSLSYLDMVISETLRIFPILPALDREALEPYRISNSSLVIEKGMPIFISILGMHNDPKYFPDPEKFDPERFNEENKKNIPSFVYMPFGGGPRQCIAGRLGLLQTKLGIIKTLCRYEVTPCEKTMIPLKLDPKCPITMSMDGKLYLKIQKLNSFHTTSAL